MGQSPQASGGQRYLFFSRFVRNVGGFTHVHKLAAVGFEANEANAFKGHQREESKSFRPDAMVESSQSVEEFLI